MRCPFQTIDMPFVSLDISRQEDCLIATFFKIAVRCEWKVCRAMPSSPKYSIRSTSPYRYGLPGTCGIIHAAGKLPFCKFVLILTSNLPYLKANLYFVNTAPANIIAVSAGFVFGMTRQTNLPFLMKTTSVVSEFHFAQRFFARGTLLHNLGLGWLPSGRLNSSRNTSLYFCTLSLAIT